MQERGIYPETGHGNLALQVANRGYVLQVGKIVLEGNLDEFKGYEIVKRAYLGEAGPEAELIEAEGVEARPQTLQS